jgi:hypothetical protein
MNRLVLVPCLVIASYVAFASYIAWPTIVHEHGRSRVGLSIPTSLANRGEIPKDHSSPKEQTSSVLPSYETPNKPVTTTARTATAVSPGYNETTWVTVLLPAMVHAGPAVDTPIIQFYAVGTPLHATRYQNDWFEVIEPGTSKSGWIYRKYIGAIGNSEQGKIASQEAQDQRPVAEASVPAKRYAKTVAVKRHANIARPTKQFTAVKSAATRPISGRTEMVSLLQRAFSGY